MMVFRLKNQLCLTLFFAFCMCNGVALGIPLLFSIDNETDEFVQIDAATGQVNVIGSLGFDAIDADLTRIGNRLFAANSEFSVRVDLHEINPLTGASISSDQVSTSGGPIVHAEGLGQVGGQLKIGYSTTNDAFSNGLGDLALNGAITNTQTGNLQIDFDGLGADPDSGTLYSVDVFPMGNASAVEFYTVNPSPLVTTMIGSFSSNILRANDLAISGDTLYAIDSINQQLHVIDLNTPNSLSSVPILRDGNYRGLATSVPSVVNTGVVPEPITAALGLMGLGVLGLATRRRAA